MINIAVIGAGGYAFEMIKKILKLPNLYKLVAVTSNPERCSPGADYCTNRDIKVYANVDDLIKNVEGVCDVVYIPTPIHTHLKLAKKIITAGFDIFLEKPPVATIQELDDLTDFSRSYGKVIPVCFQCLYCSAVQSVKDYIVNGKLGKILSSSSKSLWYRLGYYYNRADWVGKIKNESSWILDGTMNNPLAHVLADQLYLATDKPHSMADVISVQAELYHGNNIESEDSASIRLITTDNVEIVFNATLCAEKMEPIKIFLKAENGTVEFYDLGKVVIRFNNGSTETVEESCDNRIYMLKQLANSYENNLRYSITIDQCRPFTKTVNGAFESSRQTYPIDKKYIFKYNYDNGQYEPGIKTEIVGINYILHMAYEQRKLLSELNIPWAVRTGKFTTTGYSEFPQQFNIHTSCTERESDTKNSTKIQIKAKQDKDAFKCKMNTESAS